jgi:HK97 family phage prohead protease
MQTKTCPATIKAAGAQDGTEEGVFEAVVATYDVDSVGDQIIPGAFAETLAHWKASEHPIPVIWSHKSDDPDYHIGYVLDAEERPGVGLWVKGRIDIDDSRSKSAQVYRLLKGRRVRNLSFSYDELDARPASEKSAPGARKELHRLKVYEVGPCLIGANQATSVIDVKSDPATVTVNVGGEGSGNADSRLTAALDAFETELKSAEVETKAAPPGFTPKPIVARIRKLVAAAQALLDAVEPSDSNAEKATPASPAGAPASQVAEQAAPETKSAEPAPAGTASARLRTDLALMELDVASYTI